MDMSGVLIHLICGSTGAGKTTYAQKLADELGGVRFSIDEWMTALFWMDTPQPLDPLWSMARVERCYGQIWETARRVAARGVPSILDLGFSSAESRGRYLLKATEAGLSARLHYIDVSSEARWRRVEARNAQKGETYQLSIDVTREMFDFVETLFEPPTPDELRAADSLCIRE
jgi:predicted kinase